MPTFVEGDLEFTFNSAWKVLKYDKESFYRTKVQRLAFTMAVDFIGISLKSKCLYLIEVKDYRKEHPGESMESLAQTIGRKCRDTVAGLAGAVHTTGDAKWDDFLIRAIDSSDNIKIVFLFERRPNASKVMLDQINEKLKSKLGWLTPRVLVVTLENIEAAVPGLKVRNLPGAGQI